MFDRDYSNNAPHHVTPDGSWEPALNLDLINAGFGLVEPDDHNLLLIHQGDTVEVFSQFASPSAIRAECYDHLKTHGAEFAEVLHAVKHQCR